MSGKGTESSSVAFGFATGSTAGLAIGSVSPWLSGVTIELEGIGNDGRLTFLIAVLAAFALSTYRTAPRRSLVGFLALLGVVAALVAIGDLLIVMQANPVHPRHGLQGDHVGWGLWISSLAALCLAVSAFNLASLDDGRG